MTGSLIGFVLHLAGPGRMCKRWLSRRIVRVSWGAGIGFVFLALRNARSSVFSSATRGCVILASRGLGSFCGLFPVEWEIPRLAVLARNDAESTVEGVDWVRFAYFGFV